MKDEALTEILDRNGPKEYIAGHLNDSIALMKEIVNYGTNLILRCYNSSNKDEVDIVILCHFLKQGIMLLDAIEVQINSGSVLAAHITARSLLENYILTKWIIDDDTEHRALQFYVSSLRNKYLWAKRALSDSAEHEEFSSVFEKIGKGKIAEDYDDYENEEKKKIEAIDHILADPKFSGINTDLERCRGNLLYEIEWYKTPDCRRSIWKISIDIGMKAEYQVLYSHFSSVTHNAASDKHIAFDDDKIVFQPIRSIDNIGNVMMLAISYTIDLYRLILGKYRPAEITNFSNKYKDEWQERHLGIVNPVTKVSYRDT